MQMVLATADVQPRDRLAYWHDVACKVFVDHECRVQGSSTFSATIHHAPLDQLEIAHVESDGLRESTRRARGIAHGEDNVFFLCAQLSGTSIMSQDGRDAAMHPGDFMLLDAQRTCTNIFPGPYGLLVIKIPHRAMKARLASSSQLTACTISGATGIGGLTSDFIRMIPERIDDLTPTVRAQIGEQVLDLVALALAAECGKDRPALSSPRAIALLQLRAAVEQSSQRSRSRSCRCRWCRRHQRALCERTAQRRRVLARAADRVAPSRALPPRTRRSCASSPVDRRDSVRLGFLRPVALHSPLQGRLRQRAA